MNLKAQKVAALVIAALGAALLAMMIIVEDEFGALPLALLVAGSVWYGGCWVQERRDDP